MTRTIFQMVRHRHVASTVPLFQLNTRTDIEIYCSGLNRSAPAPAAAPSFANPQSPFNEQPIPFQALGHVPPASPPASSYEPQMPGPSPMSKSLRQETYPPPASRDVSPPRSQSQPPSTRKSVQFAAKPEFSNAAPAPSEVSSVEAPRPKHKHSHSRGYEAGDDTDSTPDEQRRGNRETVSRSLQPDSIDQQRKWHRRRRSADPSSSRGEPSSRPQEPEIERVKSPDSDVTIDLPPRFDEKGRKRAEPGDDPLADRFDEVLAGKGVAGKMFGNFLDGFFGPNGRKKKGR